MNILCIFFHTEISNIIIWFFVSSIFNAFAMAKIQKKIKISVFSLKSRPKMWMLCTGECQRWIYIASDTGVALILEVVVSFLLSKCMKKSHFVFFLWFLGTANVLKILDTKNHIIILNIFVWKKIHKKVIDIYHFELVWTPTAGRGNIPIKRSSRAWKFNHFSIFAQLSPSQKYIYTWSLQKFLDVLKSYESESFISAGLSPVAQDYDTPWHPSFVGILENSQIPTCTALLIGTIRIQLHTTGW